MRRFLLPRPAMRPRRQTPPLQVWSTLQPEIRQLMVALWTDLVQRQLRLAPGHAHAQ
jgi:hypothetical protein